MTARIALSMLNEAGHVYIGMAFARRLRRAGHDVVFVGLPEQRERVESQGFSYITIGEGIYDDTTEKRFNEQHARWRASPPRSVADAVQRLAGQIKLIREGAEQRRAIYRQLVDEAPSFRKYGWDLLIHDYYDSTGGLVANKAGIPCICLVHQLPDCDRRVPPLWTEVPADNRLESRLRVALEWKKQELLHMVRRVRPDNLLWSLLARHYRITDENLFADFMVPPLRIRKHMGRSVLNIPMLIACPRAFDFEHEVPGNWFYIEHLADLERKEPAFDWSFLRPDSRLIYVSMGTQSWLMSQPRRFFLALVESMKNQTDLQMILNVGSYFDPAELGSHPNVTVVQSAPQISVLARASLMITHGGLNSIKECVMHGVPMIAFPVAYDQPGNTARLLHHGLGLAGDYRKVDADQIRAMCREVMANPSFALAVDRMRKAFVAADAAGVGVEIVERVLSLPSRSAA